MLASSDYDLSLSLRYEGPAKEALKKTILRQEFTFNKQVYELHRLYHTQKDMMKDLSWKELGGAYFSRGGRQGNPVTFGNFISPSSMFVDQKRVCSIPKDFNWSREQQDTFPAFQQRLSNPQIYSPHYLDHIDRGNLNKRHGCCNNLENSIEKNHYYRGGVAHHPGEVNLSLSIGRNNLKTSARTKTFDHIIDLEESDETPPDTKTGGRTKTWNNFIDLEESNQTVSNAELNPQSPLGSGRVSYSGYKRDYQCTHAYRNHIKDNWFDGTPRNYFVPDGSTSCLEQNPLAEGVEQCERSLLSRDTSAKGKVLFSDERAFLDLNKSIFDDFFYSDDPSLSCSSSKDSSRGSHGILNSMTGSNHGYKRMENVGVEQCEINLNQPLSNSSGSPCRLNRNSDYEKADLTVKFLDSVDQIPSTPENKSKKAKQDPMSSPEYKTQDFVKDSGPDKSLSLGKSSCFEDISSGIKTIQSGTQKLETLQANKFPCQLEDVDFSSNDNQMGETSEVDGQIIKGAVSLVYFALECSEPSIAISIMNKIEGETMGKPQCSSETFEEMVLKQPESSIDDSCVNSNAFEFNATKRKDNGITLKRGRRMKDFQRDIMPSLATLSRHEICEDVKIMETALRSREYKKLRSKMTGEHKWFNPVRNRRSRLKCVGRKYYS